MPAFKTVYSPDAALGGYEYRARSNGSVVNIQERSPRSDTFKTKAVMTQSEWEKYVDDNGMDSLYNSNPALLAKLVDL